MGSRGISRRPTGFASPSSTPIPTCSFATRRDRVGRPGSARRGLRIRRSSSGVLTSSGAASGSLYFSGRPDPTSGVGGAYRRLRSRSARRVRLLARASLLSSLQLGEYGGWGRTSAEHRPWSGHIYGCLRTPVRELRLLRRCPVSRRLPSQVSAHRFRRQPADCDGRLRTPTESALLISFLDSDRNGRRPARSNSHAARAWTPAMILPWP